MRCGRYGAGRTERAACSVGTDRAGCSVQELLLLPLGVTGNTSASGAEESRFDPWRGNFERMMRPAPKGPGASLFCGSNSSELSRQRRLPKRPPVSERTCFYFPTEVHAHTHPRVLRQSIERERIAKAMEHPHPRCVKPTSGVRGVRHCCAVIGLLGRLSGECDVFRGTTARL